MGERRRRAIVAKPGDCYGCLTCELRCSLRFEKAFNRLKSQIRVQRLVGEAEEFAISFGDRCDGCGICARACPYGALVRDESAEAG